MSDIIQRNSSLHHSLQPVLPRIDFYIRLATMDDFGWIDAMQKAESDKLGFLMKMAIEKRIEQSNVLVACSAEEPLGYCIAVDRYMKQDHVGQFIQLNVTPGQRRSLVGAALVKATFEKSAYGVKLYGLWCRQDLAANHFWESLGFVPLAFRAAGQTNRDAAKKKADPRRQVHIYWQRRVREGDSETPYWFPFETQGGMMAESRVVLPIPLGTHWSDAKPVVLPGAERRAEEARLLEAGADEKAQADKAALAMKRKEAREAAKRAKKIADGPTVIHGVEVSGGGVAGVPMGFDLPPEAKAQKEAEVKAAAAAAEKERIKQEKREAKQAAKQARRNTDPELLAFSRELRDRWQEAVAPGSEGAALLEDAGRGKYDVARLIAGGSASGCVNESDAVNQRVLVIDAQVAKVSEGSAVRRLGAA